MADGRHFENRFLIVTPQQPIVRFQLHFAQGSRMAWR